MLVLSWGNGEARDRTHISVVLTWINFNLAWIIDYINYKVRDEIIIPKHQQLHRWSLGMDK